ncbi:hypothetical protein BDFB_012900 [Asbolus verrucosus]|uniref:C2H2-type domain-containing protein n=1 Tax=Asbolus verrucosus TaxID=1661398 RepID=A0A482VC75_ASBVE|nr:hypothetical protein BDFB_012900 [Asbolus verrucosus]
MSVCIIHGRKKIYFCEVVTHFKVLLDNHTNIVHKELEVNEDLRNILKSYECGECDFQTNSVVVLLRHFCDSTHDRVKKNLKVRSFE